MADVTSVLANWMSDAELAAELDVTTVTLRRWRAQKIGPPWSKAGRRIRYHRPNIEAWLKAVEQRPNRPRTRAPEQRTRP